MAAPVETAADDLLGSLTADHLAAPANPSGVNLTPEQLKAIALQNAQRGYWVTGEQDDRLVRMGANGVPVMLASGKRLELPFRDYVHELAGGVAAQQAQQQQQPAPSFLPGIGGGSGATVPQSSAPPSPVAP